MTDDDNKHTALTSAGLFLKKNGSSLTNSHEEKVEIGNLISRGVKLGRIGEQL